MHRSRSLITVPLTLLFTALLAGCAAIPAAVDIEPAHPEPTLAQAQQEPDHYSGRRVRWGGTIVAVGNAAQDTELEIIARPLERSTRPDVSRVSPGRFMALVSDFLDPREYEEGRPITVVGTLDGIEQRKIGDFDYRYPRVLAEGHHLWPAESAYRPMYHDPYYRPYWHDPWYRPWWHDPWYPYWRPYRW